MLTHPKAPRRRLLPAVAVAVALVAVAALPARADLTGDYDGQLTPKKAAAVPLDIVFTQSGKLLTAQGALLSGVAELDGIYTFTGKASGKKKVKVKLKGLGATGAKMTFQGTVSVTSIAGKAKIKNGSAKLNGKLVLTFNAPKDESACLATYTANKDFFDTTVYPVMTGICGTCHVPGGQSASARFKVDVSNAEATALSSAQEIDDANPDASRLVQKPLNLLPHGGGVMVQAGSSEEAKLKSWAELLASAHCAQ
jgi:hypothetical protein